MNNDIKLQAKQKFDKAILNLEERFNAVRAGRANPSILDGVMVSYYGTLTPIKQLATISVPEARQINIKPFDRSILSAIEKAIFEANLGLTPNNNGEVVFISIPQLTEDRRKELVKQVKELAEEGRISVRNIRHDMIEYVEKQEFSEDLEKAYTKDIQDLVNDYNKKIDEKLKEKEQELLTI